MSNHGSESDAQLVGNLFVDFALCNQREYLDFSISQNFFFGRWVFHHREMFSMRMPRTLQVHQLLDELRFWYVGTDAVETLQLGIRVTT